MVIEKEATCCDHLVRMWPESLLTPIWFETSNTLKQFYIYKRQTLNDFKVSFSSEFFFFFFVKLVFFRLLYLCYLFSVAWHLK